MKHKKIHRFYIEQVPEEEEFSIKDPKIIHLVRNVLRFSTGEQCIFFGNDTDDTVASLIRIEKGVILFKKENVVKKVSIPKRITAFVAITKKDMFELVVQKMTELGVSRVVPVVSDRTVKQSLRIDRLQKISDEALEQSGHSHRMLIDTPKTLSDALKECEKKYCVYFDTGKITKNEGHLSAEGFFIGPEGGWTDDEREFFDSNNITKSSLGGTILRAETAAIVGAYSLLWQ